MFVFDLAKFQENLFKPAEDIIGSYQKTDRLPKMKIVDLYTRCRANNRLTTTAFKALQDQNKYVKLAALDLITTFVDERSIDYLFRALEDEEDMLIRQKIVEAIDKVESKIKKYADQTQISTVKNVSYGWQASS